MISPNALIVPSLATLGYEREVFSEVAALQRVCTANGIRPVLATPPIVLSSSEHVMDLSTHQRGLLAQEAGRFSDVIGEVDVVVIANAATENIFTESRTSPVCQVPYSIGRFAGSILTTANTVWGENSGRVFISRVPPDTDELNGLETTRNAVRSARKRLQGISLLGVISLDGDYAQMINAAKTPRPRRGVTK